MATYLLTGVAGFIASRVAEFLLDSGHKVIGVDNLNGAYDVRLKHWRLARLESRPEFEFLRLDITDRNTLARLLEVLADIDLDAAINLAARAGVRQSIVDPWVYFDTNVTGTLNMLELCRQSNVKKFVLASSSSLYGNSTEVPFKEDFDTSHPISPYAASKKAAEVLCQTYHHLYGIDVTMFRYFTVYGPAGRPDMSPFRFVQWISEGKPLILYGDGLQSRDFTYVDDIARGTIAGLRRLGCQIINLGSDKPVVLMEMIHLVESLVGRRACIDYRDAHPGDVLATWADIGKAERLLDWHPCYSFRQGIEATAEWYEANRHWVMDIVT